MQNITPTPKDDLDNDHDFPPSAEEAELALSLQAFEGETKIMDIDLSKMKQDNVRNWMENKKNIYIGPEFYTFEASRWYTPLSNLPLPQPKGAEVKELDTDEHLYEDFLLYTDLILDIQRLRGKTFGYIDNDGKRIASFLRTLQDQDNRIALLVTKRNRNSTSKNLRKYWPIVGLQHVTDSQNVKTILLEGLLTWLEIRHTETIEAVGLDLTISPPTEWEKKDPRAAINKLQGASFPGVYFLPVLASHLDTGFGWSYGDRVGSAIIVDPYLLNRFDYHVNAKDDHGRISDQTWSRETLVDLLDRLPLIGIGEIVFHNRIEPKYIRAVVDLDQADKYQKTPYYNDKNHAYEREILVPHTSRFCTRWYAHDTVSNLDDLEYKTARNCHMSPREIITAGSNLGIEISKRSKIINSFVDSDGKANTDSRDQIIYFPPYSAAPLLDTPQERKAYDSFLIAARDAREARRIKFATQEGKR